MKKLITAFILIAVLATPNLLSAALTGFSGCKMIDSTENIWMCKATGAAAMEKTLAPAGVWELMDVRVTLNAAGTSDTFTATIDSKLGAGYDILLISQDFTTVTDYREIFEPDEARFQNGDEFDFQWTNTNTKTWGLEVYYKLH